MEDAIVVGAGQAGLAVAYCLRRRNIDPLLLDAAAPGKGSAFLGFVGRDAEHLAAARSGGE